MRGSTLVVVVALIASLVVPGVGAEGDGSERFYVTDVDVGTGDACDDAGRQYEGSNERPAAGKAYGGTSAVGVACAFTVAYTTTEDYQLSGDVAIEFWSNCEAGATIEQDYRLIINDVTIADIRGGEIGPCASTEEPLQGGGVHGSQDLFVPAGSAVLMRFALFSGPEPGAGPVGNAYITVGGDMPSGFAVAGWGIPFIPSDDGPAPTVYEDVATAQVEAAFDNATSGRYVYNFTNDLSAAVASFVADGTGAANATLTDADGVVLFNDTVETMEVDLGNVTTGAWQLFVDYTDFSGTFAFELLSLEQAGGSADGDDSPAGGDVDGNATGNETVDGADDQESPGLPMLVGLGAVAFVAALRRRR